MLSDQEVAKLKRGDVITNLGSGDSYLVIADAIPGQPATAIRALTVTNGSEWEKVSISLPVTESRRR